jgi:uncharacterized damage-inducible protein DinB
MMTRGDLLKLWTDAWDAESWVAPWSKAVDLSPEQAAWAPAPGRHSVWQIVGHVVYWREYTLDRIAGKPKPTPAQTEALNFPEPGLATATAWNALRARLSESHQRIAAAIAEPAVPLDRLGHHVYHDAYHLGQVMYLRALQGLKAIE